MQKHKTIALFIVLFIIGFMSNSFGDPRMPKSCTKKVLLPGAKKAVKCSKARNIKNAYF